MKTLLMAMLLGVAGVVSAADRNEPVQPIVPPGNINIGMVELGKKLYFDPRLSRSGFISCNSCHNLSMGGTDNIPTSIGDRWQQGPINSPTVLNSSLNVAQFWDGRAADLKEQAGGPIENPREMGFSHTLAVDVLESIPGYAMEFRQVFGNTPIGIDEVTTAIAEFEKTLVTPNSPFDHWLLGDDDALNEKEMVTRCSRRVAASPATMDRRWAARRFRKWASSSPTRRGSRLRAAATLPVKMRTASTSKCRRCVTSS